MTRPADWHPAIIAAAAKAYGRANGIAPVYWEIGVHKGDCTREVAPHTRLTVAVDITFDNLDLPHPAAVRERWPEMAQLSHAAFRFFEMPSQQFFEDEAPNLSSPDLIFIDADHSYEAAGRDFEHALSYLAEDGTIFMHDTWPALVADTDERICGTVHKVPPLLANDPSLSVWTIPLFPGLTAISRRALPPVLRAS